MASALPKVVYGGLLVRVSTSVHPQPVKGNGDWYLDKNQLMNGGSSFSLHAGDSSPPLQTQTPEGSAPARAPSIALKKHVAFTGLTVELFEDIEEVRVTLLRAAAETLGSGVSKQHRMLQSAKKSVGVPTMEAIEGFRMLVLTS